MLIKFSITTDEMLLEFQTRYDAFIIWQNLQNMHETSDKSRVFFLKNIPFPIKMEKHDSLQDHYIKIKEIRARFKAIDTKMEGKDLVIITLKSLPSSENFIETLNITSNIDLTFEQLSNKLLQKDSWRKQFGNSSGHDISKIALAEKFDALLKNYQEETTKSLAWQLVGTCLELTSLCTFAREKHGGQSIPILSHFSFMPHDILEIVRHYSTLKEDDNNESPTQEKKLPQDSTEEKPDKTPLTEDQALVDEEALEE